MEERRLLSQFTVSNATDNSVANTLRWAIQQADSSPGSNTIVFDPSVFSTPRTITLETGPLSMTGGTTTIDGPGAGLLTVSANQASRDFQVGSGVTATISGLTIAGGKATDGGGVYNAGNTTLANCTIIGNTATKGGGVYGGGTMALSDCTISGNSATSGAGLYVTGTATLTGCTISGNSARDGGALYNLATATLTGCTLSGNSANYGGGLWNYGAANLTGCTISGNSAYMGSGVENYKYGQATLTNCTISGNSASLGGGLSNYGHATLTACTVSGNTATNTAQNPATNPGGGIYNYSNHYGGLTTLTDSIVAGNSGSGGAASDIGGNNANSVIGTNDLVGTGGSGGVRNGNGGDIVLSSLTGLDLAPLGDYGGPTPTMALLPGSAAIGAGAAAGGVTTDQRGFALDSPVDLGAFQAVSAPTVVDVATDGVGAPPGQLDLRGAVDLADIQPGAATITFDPTVFDAPSTITLTAGPLRLTGTGGPIALDGPAAGLTLAGGGTGGVLQIGAGVTATISGLTLSGGSAALGGGLYNQGTATLTDCAIVGNTAAGNGGGLANIGVLDLFECTVSGNTAGGGGGGLFSDSRAYLTACTVSGNTAGGGGGGLYEGSAGSDGATLGDTIVAGNAGIGGSAGDIGGHDAGNVTGTYNLIGPGGSGGIGNGVGGNIVLAGLGSPVLAPSGDYGGTTPTMALLPGSPAIDAGSNALIPAGVHTDQRGEPRVTNGTVDIGAFESQGFTMTPVAGSTPQSAAPGTTFAHPLAVSISASNPAEPVAGGVVTFSVSPAAGASAGLSAASAIIGAGGTAQVTATASSTNGTYGVTATAAGAAPVSFTLTNEDQLAFSGLADQSIVFGTAGATFSGTIAAGAQVPAGEDVAVSLDGVSQQATIQPDGSFSTTFTDTAGLGVAGAPYTVEYSYSGDATFAAASQTSTLTVTPAAPSVSVTISGGIYDGSAFIATATVAGVVVGVDDTPAPSLEGEAPSLAYYSGTYSNASDLSTLTPLSGAPSSAGSYTVLASFPGSADYIAATGLANFAIVPAIPAVNVSDAGGTYSGTAFIASATVTGLSGSPGANLEGVAPTLTYYSGTYSLGSDLSGVTPLPGAPVVAGAYTVLAAFGGSIDYTAATGLANFTIGQATPAVSVSDAGGSYSGSSFGATVTVTGVSGPGGISLEGVTPSLSYYAGTYASVAELSGLTALSGAPVYVGAYTVLAAYNGSTDYTAATGLANFTIGQATPTVNVVDAGGTYTSSPFPATATVAGVVGGAGASLEGVGLTLSYYAGTALLGAAPSAAGTYTVAASFAGSTDYLARSAQATFTIAQATPTVRVTDAGGTYNGSPFPGTATVAGVSGLAGGSLEGIGTTLSYYAGSTLLGTAPSAAGTYTVQASFAGSTDYLARSVQAAFTIAQATPTVRVTDAGGTYSGSPFGAAATVTGVSGPGGVSLEGVTPSLSYYSGTYASVSQLSGLTALSGTPILAGNYTVLAVFGGSTDYATSSGLADFGIGQATPEVSVTDAGGTYTGSSFAAEATVTGVSGPGGPSLEGVVPSLSYYAGDTASGTPMGAAPSAAGTYTVAASFAGSTDYLARSAQATFTIAQATPTVRVTDAGGTYNGSPFPATATVAGVSGLAGGSLESVGLTLSYFAGSTLLGTAPSAAGTYTVAASFAGSADYLARSAQVTFTIAQATPTVRVSDDGGTYTGSSFAAEATVTGIGGFGGGSLEGVGLTLSYFAGSTLLGTAPSAAGTYTVAASFAGSTNYLAQSAQATFTIAQATPTVNANDPGGTYSGSPFPATATVTGVSGPGGTGLEGVTPSLNYYAGTYTTAAQVSGLAALSEAPVRAGAYTVLAAFGGSTDYAAASGLTDFTIGRATPAVAWNPPAAIVYGTALSTSQLDASTDVAGDYLFSPAAGALLGAGVRTLSVTFMPTDATDFTTVQATTTIQVGRATPTVSVIDNGGVYDGAPFAATAVVAEVGGASGASLEGISPALTYYAGTAAAGVPMTGAPTAVGTYTVIAAFPGSADYASAQSAPVTVTITAATDTVALESSAGSTVYGQPVTLVATVSPGSPAAGMPAGTITFYDGSTTLGAVTLDASGQASLIIGGLGLGGHSITAVYGGGGSFLGGQSGAIPQSVVQAGTEVVLVPHPVLKKKKVISLSLTAEVEPMAPGTGVPGGVATFLIKKKSLGTATLSGGQATLTVKPGNVLNKSITVIYGGDAEFRSSSLAPLRLTTASLATLARRLLRPLAASHRATLTRREPASRTVFNRLRV